MASARQRAPVLRNAKKTAVVGEAKATAHLPKSAHRAGEERRKSGAKEEAPEFNSSVSIFLGGCTSVHRPSHDSDKKLTISEEQR
jgi:hypothetical protein